MYSFRKISALLVSFVIICIAFIVFIFKLINISINDDFQELKSENIKSNVEISTNFYGIPYFESKDENDLYFAIGYYQASMRLWQMDYYRRLASGRLSEIFGSETIKIDKFMRCFDIEQITNKNYDSLSGKSKTILDSYANGVNFFIQENSKYLPLEFNALNYKPEKWKPAHSLMIGKLLTFELSLSIWGDITFGEIFDKYGAEKLKLFMPDEEYNTILYNSANNNLQKNIKSTSLYSDELFKIKDKIGITGSSSGSNCWVFRNEDSTGNFHSILANDAHLMLMAPARWIQMKIKSPEINALGLTIPGIPLIISGRNQSIAWGITNIMLDGFDYFFERLDDKQENYLSSDSTMKKIIYVVDTIKIAGKSDEIYYKRKTENSYLISDFHILSDPELMLNFKDRQSEMGIYNKNVFSFRWVGNNIDDDIYALYKINTARNFNEFKDATRHWASPGLNFHYTDVNGNIGVLSAGYIPIRNDSCNPNIPNPAWIKEYSWKNVKKLSDSTYSMYNPAKNFIASANNKISTNNDIFISNYWEPDSRVKRIHELLSESDNLTYRDAQYLQNDYLSVYSRELLNICIPILESYTNLLTEDERELIELLKKWDFIMSRASVEAALYTFYYEKLLHNTLFDELTIRLYKQYNFISSLPTRKILMLFKQNDSELFDIKGTKNIENKEFIIFKSFRDAVVEFNSYFGAAKLNERTYGKMHTLTLNHPFSSSNFLNPAVSLGPFETGGNNTTINNGEWNLNNPYKQAIGASMRIVCDMSSDYIYTSIPGGISGDHIHPNYSDQLQIWLNGGYVKLPFSLENDSTGFKLKMKFSPE
jgi:penicillin amidase